MSRLVSMQFSGIGLVIPACAESFGGAGILLVTKNHYRRN